MYRQISKCTDKFSNIQKLTPYCGNNLIPPPPKKNVEGNGISTIIPTEYILGLGYMGKFRVRVRGGGGVGVYRGLIIWYRDR